MYRIPKAQDLIANPADVVIEAADEFHDKTARPNQLWQTDFTYLEVIGWGWYTHSTILDDFSRYVMAWKLCTAMRADDVSSCSGSARGHRGRASTGRRPRSAKPCRRSRRRGGQAAPTSDSIHPRT